LEKTEIADALRELGKPEREIQKLIDGMDKPFLGFHEFKALIEGKARPYVTTVGVAGYDLSVPNLAKVHDVPLLGAFTGATQNLVSNLSMSLMGVAFTAAFGKLTDEQLKNKFIEIDSDGSGKLNAKEIAAGLRSLKVNEADIKQVVGQLGTKELDFDSFKALVKPVAGNRSIHDAPVVGHFTAFFADSFGNAFGFGKMTPEEMKAAFNKMDKDKSGTLEKTEIADALRELGKPERGIQKLIDGMEEESLNFTEFEALIKGKARPYITTVGVAGFELSVPNLAKVHDVPILGAFTGATQNLAMDMSMGLMGVAFSAAFGTLSDDQLKQKFKEIDVDKSGKLNAKEIATALRELGLTEADIKQIVVKVGKDELDFEGFKKLVR